MCRCWALVMLAVAFVACSDGDSAESSAPTTDKTVTATASEIGTTDEVRRCERGPFIDGEIVTSEQLDEGCVQADGEPLVTLVYTDCLDGGTFFVNDLGYGFVDEPFVADDQRATDPYTSGCYELGVPAD